MCQVVRAASTALGRDVTHLEAARWACENLKMHVKGASWAVYKSAHLAQISSQDEKDAVREIYLSFGKNKPGERRQRTPGKRQKSWPLVEQNELLNELKRPSYSRWGLSSRLWIVAGKATGCRPIEWLESRIVTIEGSPFLRVKNAKLISWDSSVRDIIETQGRNAILYRNIPLSHLTAEAMEYVGAQAAMAQKMAKDGLYDAYYEGVRKTIARAGKALWPARTVVPSLYTARHVYRDELTIRLRAQGFSTEETDILVSVILGHGSRKTKYAYGVGSDELSESSGEMSVGQLSSHVKVLLKQSVSIIE